MGPIVYWIRKDMN